MVWPVIPDDAIFWFRAILSEANRTATERLLNVPNIRETSLDDGLIESIVPRSAPRLLPSGAVVELQIHNIGGLRRLYRWETADVAVLVFIYRSSALISQKIGLLQSKRLFPLNNDVVDDDPVGFYYGMNQYVHRDSRNPIGLLHREFEFNENCTYSSLKSGSDQLSSIESFNDEFGEAIYYLLYNPPSMPITVQYPVTNYQTLADFDIGCRVYTATDVHSVLRSIPQGRPPSYKDISSGSNSSNWRLEDWAEHLLRCSVGKQYSSDKDIVVEQLLTRRSGPIGAAIAVSISLPESTGEPS